MTKQRTGFTLLELLVVISIIAVLIGLSTVSFSTAQKKSRNTKRRGDIKAVQNAFEQYYAATGAYAANCSTMTAVGTTPTLPNGIPTDPKNEGSYTYALTCTTSTYCACAYLEGETGNSSSDTCVNDPTGSYYCLSNLQ